MQTQTNKINTYDVKKHSLLAGAFLVLVVLGAKIDLDVGGNISFTLQTLFLGLAYFYLPLYFRWGLIVTYLSLGIAGVPVFNGGVGWDYFVSWPLGFFVGFILAAFVPKPTNAGFLRMLVFFMVVHLIIVFCGLIGYSTSWEMAWQTFGELSPGMVIKSVVGAGIVALLRRV